MASLNFEYESPANFKSLSETDNAKQLWKYLCSSESLIRMETATYLKKPALEPLAPHLQMTFDFFQVEKTDKSTYDRFKQLAGSMVRSIMEEQGYEHEKSSVNILTGTLFNTASRYVKPQ